MSVISEFLRQKVPKYIGEIPLYYRRALAAVETLLLLNFSFCMLLFPWANNGRWEFFPVAMIAAAVLCLLNIGRIHVRLNVAILAMIIVCWSGWFIYSFGWGCGAQHFFIPLLILVFFNVYEPPVFKIAYFFGLVSYRMILYSYTLYHTERFPLSETASVVMQTVNSMTLFLMVASVCILFSTSIQDTERKLRLDNQELHKEAGTDPLTQLPNRRAMLDTIEKFQKNNSSESFCVAIADIDFFKKVNDTYGHLCGDYTLVELTNLFRRMSEGKYEVCRWGGEEFCLFIPNRNLDEAGIFMNDLCVAAEKMQLHFEEHDFSITITIGVEEYDFVSSLEDILNAADNKLYMGKEAGRNRVVV